MTKPVSRKSSTRFPRAKIARAVRTLLPNENFKLQITDSQVDRMKIVRVITPEWKTLRPAQRITKVLRAVEGRLTADEQERILRFSVLTPAEYDSLPGR